MLEKEGVDFAIGTYLSETGSTRGLRTHFLWPIHLSCLMRRDHPLAKGTLTRKRFLAARHVDVRLPGMNAPIYDSVLATHGLQRNLVISLNHYNQALAVLAGADYIGVLPTSLLDNSPYADLLLSRAPPIAMPVRPLGISWHQRSDGDMAHQWLRTAVVELFEGAGH
jgi:DNA-binding transcriptional LysR family regulator